MKAPDLDSSSLDFIRERVAEDVKASKNGGRVHTRFPPEPNGYLHIGHAKSICLNFGVAAQYKGLCNLRFDDTNPSKETVEFEESIMRDVRWLGFDWDERLFYASDYFEKLYEYAVHLIKDGNAYVDSLSADEIREYRGTLTEPGRNSPYRNRSVEENLELFHRMRAGDFEDGTHVLRAKIDMGSPNINMRDPVLFRIMKVTHYRQGSKWVIYPMYDYAHPISDALEDITHSLCTLEFEDHRPLYDWCLENLPVPSRPVQIEFARLNLSYTVLSTRKVPFGRVLYIEQEDFREDPPNKFFRLAPGREVRLRYAYFITCKEVVKDGSGNIVELRCTYDPATRGGDAPPGRPSPKATLHWVSAPHALAAEVRLYDRLFNQERPDNDSPINPGSLEVLTSCQVEPSLKGAE